jgi:mannitol/fructose-specific phosphotransferase system IIA component (Ntr-type)
MITIADILRPEDIELDLKMTNQEEAVQYLAALLREDERVTDWAAFYEGLAHMKPCVGAISGSGICIPHARTNGVSEMVMSVGRSGKGIAVKEAAGLVHFIFVIGVPIALAADYLRIIGAIARIFKDPATSQKLQSAEDAEELLKVLASAEMKL